MKDAKANQQMCTRIIGAIMAFCLIMPRLLLAQGNALTFVTPVDGQVVRPGETIPVVLGVDASLSGATINIWPLGLLSSAEFDDPLSPPYEVTVTVPEDMTGRAIIYAYARDAVDVIETVAVEFNVLPEDSPVEISAGSTKLMLKVPSGSGPQYGSYDRLHPLDVYGR